MTQTTAANDIESTFQRAWALLMSNLIIVVPGLAIGAIAVVIAIVVAFMLLGSLLVTGFSNSASIGVASFVTTGVVALALFLIAAIGQMAFVTGMSGAAWERGKATFADGWHAFTGRWAQIFYAMLLLIVAFLGALVLAPFTIGLSLFFYVVMFLYVMPAVVIGGREAMEALSESWNMARHNFWPTVGVAAIVVVVSIFGAFLGGEIGRYQPFAGGLCAMAVQQAAAAFASLAVVGYYLKTRERSS